MLDKIRTAVPEERQIEVPPSISGPILEKLKYNDEQNPLTDLYLNLLQQAIDKDRVNEGLPGFINVIDQISPDEAYLLFQLQEVDGRLKYIQLT